MAFVPVPNTVLVEVRMLLDAQKIENTLYFEKPGGWSAGDLVTLGNSFLTWWAAFYAVGVSSAVTLNEIFIRELSTASSIVQTTPAPTPHPAGDRSAASLPNNVAVTVSFRTGLSGRFARGRNYVSGLSEDAVVLNTVDSAVLADIQAGYEALQDVASDNTATWVVVSRFSGVDGDGVPIPRVEGVTTPITAVIIVDSIIDSQRRRLPGRGQ